MIKDVIKESITRLDLINNIEKFLEKRYFIL